MPGPLVVHTPSTPAKEAPIAALIAAISSSAWKVFTPKCRKRATSCSTSLAGVIG